MIPLTIFLILLGLNFLQTHIGIYQNGLKIKRSALNPRKKFIPFNDIENIELKKIEPTNYSSKFSKRLLYDLDQNPELIKTGDYISLVIKTKSGTPYNIRGSYLSEINKTKELIEIEKRKSIAIKPKKIKKIPEVLEKKPKKKEKQLLDGIPSEHVVPKKLTTYFCKYCGTKISGSGAFCIKCGKKLK